MASRGGTAEIVQGKSTSFFKGTLALRKPVRIKETGMKPNAPPSNRPVRRARYSIVILFGAAVCLTCFGLGFVLFKPESNVTAYEPGQSVRAVESRTLPGVPAQPGEVVHRVETSGLAGSSASRVYVDPVTGQIGAPPPEVGGTQRQLSPEEQSSLSTSGADLVPTPLPGPGGGVKVDLQGRFRSQTVATIDGQSKLSIQCTSETPATNHSRQENNPEAPRGVSKHTANHSDH